MRHKYETRGIVLARTPLGEANTLVTVMTPAIGLVRARAQGLRKPGAKLASALTTFAESDLTLVRGKEGWRLTGAVLSENWFERMPDHATRLRAARVSGLLLRLVAGEAQDVELFPIVNGFFKALTTLSENEQEAAELLVVLRSLAALGLDAGDIPGDIAAYAPDLLAVASRNRSEYISRINHGIAASEL